MERKNPNTRKGNIQRNIVLLLIFGVMFFILIARLFYLQIVAGEKYAENFALQIKREITLPGTRGNIYDRNGKPLAVNKLAWSVTIEDQEEYDSDRQRQLELNSKIYKTICIVKEHGDSVENRLNIRVDQNGDYEFTSDGFALDRFRADVFGKTSIEDMDSGEKNASADDIVSLLEDRYCLYSQDDKKYTEEEREEYGLPERLEKEEALEMLSVRYALALQSYQKYLSVTVAEDVSEETAAAVMEAQGELPGVNIQEDSIRVYEGGEACASVLGYTGKISTEELEEMEGQGYDLNSVIGKAGMEQYLNDVLQGRNGKQEVYVDNTGRVTEDLGVTEKARAGKDVSLTIDLELQQKTYEALERKIADILLQNLINTKTFDKAAVSDASEIKIPIYDVYSALLTNGMIDVSHFQEEDAGKTEKAVNQTFSQGKEEIMKEIQSVLEDPKLKYSDLEEEMQEYCDLIVDDLAIIDSDRIDRDSDFYNQWEKGNLSVNEYLHKAIEADAINQEILDLEEKYLTQEEIYAYIASYALQELQSDPGFDELLYRSLLQRDEILPEQVCRLLYEQKILDDQDEDFQAWSQGIISDYELMVRKIEKLEITPADLALDPCAGSAVVTDINTGEVLACVSYPGYDNNRLANQMDTEYYYDIYNNKSLPLYNRATQQLSAPGSTFKPITVIAGMEEGVIDSGTTVTCDGVFDKVEPPLRCWNHAGHGSVSSAASALQNSCNDYLCEISYRLGMKENDGFSDEQALGYIQDYAELFDLDKKTGIELTESSPQITDSYAIPSAIGQGTNNFSTVQLARYVTTLANEGTSFQLSLIDKIDGVEKESKVESTVELPQEVWDTVHTGMEWYIQNTGIFDGFSVTAAGKSGTAQEVRTRPDHGLFVGYAPADEPEIAVAVRIVNGYTAGNAVECGREIFETYFKVEE